VSAEPSEVIPSQVAAFRAEYRAREIGPHYTGWGHFALTSLSSLAVIALAISRAGDVRPVEWLAVPATFLFANLAEYFGHRGPMHHPRRGLALLFERHTRQHHRFYTHEAMRYESARDLKMVLFPPVMLLFFLGVLATPVGALLFYAASPNVAWLFVATATSYFLSYEWLHTAYHLDERSWVGRLPFMGALRRHHTTHHDQTLMTKYNFNITFPIADALFGTMRRGPRSGD
jgi:hypothetical protein